MNHTGQSTDALAGSVEPYMQELAEWVQQMELDSPTQTPSSQPTATPTHRRQSSLPIPIPGANRLGYTPPRRQVPPPLSDLDTNGLYILVHMGTADSGDVEWVPYLHDDAQHGGIKYRIASMGAEDKTWVTGHAKTRKALEPVDLVCVVKVLQVPRGHKPRVADVMEMDDDSLGEIEGLSKMKWVERACERLREEGYLKNASWEVLERELRELGEDNREELGVAIVDSKVCMGP